MSAERRAVLQGISSEIGETCNIALPNGSKMIYFDRVETHWPLRHQLPVGTQVPLYCTASGKLFLASLPGARRRRLVERLTMERCTPNTITEAARLHEALKRIRREEVGTDDEEFLEGMVAVSVPIRDARGRLCATLSTHAPVQRMSLAEAHAHVPALREAAAQLSALVGGRAESDRKTSSPPDGG